MAVTLAVITMITMAVAPAIAVVIISECRQYRQTAYRRSKGKCHHSLAAN